MFLHYHYKIKTTLKPPCKKVQRNKKNTFEKYTTIQFTKSTLTCDNLIKQVIFDKEEENNIENILLQFSIFFFIASAFCNSTWFKKDRAFYKPDFFS